MKRPFIALLLVCLSWAGIAGAAEPFNVTDIQVEGLQRISKGTLFNYLPLEIGDQIDSGKTQAIIADLYKTGFFKDINLLRDGSSLLIKVLERPSIASITIDGNNEISTEDLETGLKQAGLTEGRILDTSLLDKIKLDLQRQYFIRGYYSVLVETEVEETGENQVDVYLNIKEGEVALIQKVNIIGAERFEEEELLDRLESGVPGFFAIFSSRDQYSKQKLSADLETLKSFYMDRGYVNFNVVSTHVSITPDKSAVFVTLNIHEGEQYSIDSIELAGELVVPRQELEQLIMVKPGDTFSRRKVNDVSTAISERLGDEGFAFANVNAVPEVDEENKTVSLTYFADPGKRVYVRRINISGNEKTEDEVIRREFRQMEGAWLSTSKLNRSQVRVQRLGYLEQVNIETPLVPGSSDEVDVNMSVSERPSGTLMLGIGYSGGEGTLLNASVSQDNFLGTGERVSTEINKSKANTVYSISHTDPYYTLDGVSRSIRAFFRKTDAGEASLARYIANVWGGSVTFGIPMSEYDTVRLGIGYENTDISTTNGTPQSYIDFLAENSNEFDVFTLNLGWTRDTRNRTVFATEGWVQSLSTEIAEPSSGLDYYKVSSRSQLFAPFAKYLTGALELRLDHGDSYNDTTDLPFFEKFFAGGAHSVRGYRTNTVGPKDDANNYIGGNFRTLATAELIFPPPFSDPAENTTVRMSVFMDVGNVYEDIGAYDGSELRRSAGVALIWLSPIGPLSFSLADALNEREDDKTERFQFTLGTFF